MPTRRKPTGRYKPKKYKPLELFINGVRQPVPSQIDVVQNGRKTTQVFVFERQVEICLKTDHLPVTVTRELDG